MRILTGSRTHQAGFSLIEVIVAIVLASIVGVIFLSYMGTQLTHSGDPVIVARDEGIAEMWMERILSDYVQEMNASTYTTALATLYARDYTAGPYNMPGSVTLTRTYVTYDAMGNEVAVTAGGTSHNMKVTVRAAGYGLTSILTAKRVTSGDPVVYY
jgi:prepilin-type N-terminal cleavage/methylation domain-containing protein